MPTMLVRVTGRVQGVGFREWTRGEARALGLSGWVRNEPDGSVAALLSGPNGQVAAMLERLRRGLPAARVESMTTEPTDAESPGGFRILH